MTAASVPSPDPLPSGQVDDLLPRRAALRRLLVPGHCAGCGDWAVVLIVADGRYAPYCSLCATAMVITRPHAFVYGGHVDDIPGDW